MIKKIATDEFITQIVICKYFVSLVKIIIYVHVYIYAFTPVPKSDCMWQWEK